MATRTSRRRTTKSRRSTKKRGFEYKSRSRQDYDRSATESSGNFDAYVQDGVATFKPHDGTNRIRVLPPTFDDPSDFAYTLLVHYGVGADEQTYLCRKMLGDDEECPICDEHKRLMKEGEAEDAGEFKQRKRKGIWLLDRKGDSDDPMFWAAPFSVWKQIILVCKDEDNAVIEIDHPDEGNDITFTKEGSRDRTKYEGIKVGKTRPILTDTDEMDRVLEYVQENPLDGILNFYDPEYIQGVLEGKSSKRDEEDDDDDDDEEEDEKPRRGRKKTTTKKRTRRRVVEEDEDEDDDEELEDEDDEEEEDEDDEDEDLDDEDEEEDEDEDYDEEDEEDDEEEEDDDEEEEDQPRRRRRSSRSRGSSRTTSRKRKSDSSRLKDAANRAKSKTSTRRRRSR